MILKLTRSTLVFGLGASFLTSAVAAGDPLPLALTASTLAQEKESMRSNEAST